MDIFVDVNTRTVLAAPADTKTRVGLAAIAGNIHPLNIYFVDGKGNYIDFRDHALKVGIGYFQNPLIPIITSWSNLGVPTFGFAGILNLKRSAIRNALLGTTSVPLYFQVFTTDAHGFKTTYAETVLTVYAPVIDYGGSSSEQFFPSSSSNSSSSHSSDSSSSKSSQSSSSSSTTLLHGFVFGDPSYNGTYYFKGTFGGKPYYQSTNGGILYYVVAGDSYVVSPSLGGTQDFSSQNASDPTGWYDQEASELAAGFIQYGELFDSSSSKSSNSSSSSSSSSKSSASSNSSSSSKSSESSSSSKSSASSPSSNSSSSSTALIHSSNSSSSTIEFCANCKALLDALPTGGGINTEVWRDVHLMDCLGFAPNLAGGSFSFDGKTYHYAPQNNTVTTSFPWHLFNITRTA